MNPQITRHEESNKDRISVTATIHRCQTCGHETHTPSNAPVNLVEMNGELNPCPCACHRAVEDKTRG